MAGHSADSTATSPRRPDAGAEVATGHTVESPTPGLVRETQSAAAYRDLKIRIKDLRLRPGLRTSVAELAATLGTGVMPVREALVRLQHDGLVVLHPRSGATVVDLTLPDVQELFRMRMLLEAEAAATAALSTRDASRLQELERLVLQSSYDPEKPETITPFLEANTDFHVGIAELGGNRRLAKTLRGLLEEQERVFHLLLRVAPISDLISHEHSELLAAVIGGREDDARAVALDGIKAAQQRTTQIFLSSDVIAEANLGLATGLSDRG